MKEKLKCFICTTFLIESGNIEQSSYFGLLSRGGLTVPSKSIAEYVGSCFAILDVVSETFQKYQSIPVRRSAEFVLNKFFHNVSFACDEHLEKARKLAIKISTNTFCNNKQKYYR